ncbi:MAG TPA: sigma-54 dependent transcriptional regulator [Gemmatimonadales bacterium]|nr:sigma-54 dependent transcriptional regulator [Gemmatimonadales bacterium]
MPDAGRILVVEDDEAQRKLLVAVLQADGWATFEAGSGDGAIELLEKSSDIDVVLSDLMMPGMDGRALLAVVNQRLPEVPFVVMTAFASVDSAVELLHAGAYHYLPKPTKLPELRITVRRALEATQTKRELARLRRRVGLPSDVVGVSRQMQQVFETAIRVAPSATPVLITGETGVGKEVVARAIHGASGRDNFVALNCAALPPNLVESELFGFKRGAFTDANRDHAGLVEVAAAGTLFLDEVAEVPLATQPKLLRFLQDGEFRRLGDNTARKSAARVIAATNREPAQEVAAGRMREDLFYRLNIVHIAIPPLRERPVDIPALAEQLVGRLADRYQLASAELAPEAVAALTAYAWPGNIRELENVLARALALRSGQSIGLRDLPPEVTRTAPSASSAALLEQEPVLPLHEVERRYILRVLETTHGNKLKAAEILGIDRSTLHRKLKQMQGIAAFNP